MGKHSVLSVAPLCFLFAQAQAAQAPVAAARKTQGAKALSKINRSEIVRNLNKPVTLEGYYYDGSIPMLVEDVELVRADAPLAPDQYIPITGAVPPSVKPGARVKLTGTVRKPTGDKLSDENAAIHVVSAADATVLKPPQMLHAAMGDLVAIPGVASSTSGGRRYALLIGGGKNPANNYPRYWNDIRWMYHILMSSGYDAADIRVAYTGGVPPAAGMPVNYPATPGGIYAAIGYFVPKVTLQDTMLIMFAGQGSPPDVAGPTTVYWLWPGTPLTPAALAAQLNRITAYKRMTILMGQSFSGGFTPALTRPNRIIATSAAANKQAFTHPSYYFGNFYYWCMSGLLGKQLLGGAAVNADANNGRVSMAEMYNFALPRPGIGVQAPQFEDSGAPPSRFGTLPGAGEGVKGLEAYL